MTLNESDDLEKFLRNIDQIDELVKEFNSTDVSCQEKAIVKADQLISSLEQNKSQKTSINKTILNPNAPQNIKNERRQSQENFLRTLEKDAEERNQRRKIKEKTANALREQGNEAFSQGDYETAARFYTEGLEQLRDMQTLYTNRALAFIKLKRYKEAISDCEWALRCNEKCIKAYIHMGKSHLALKDFSQARTCYQKLLEIEPQRETMVRAYLAQVDVEEKEVLQEKAAWEEMQKATEQATAITVLLKKLTRPNQIDLYYCGGLELLSQAIRDTTGQTLLRLNNGFDIIKDNFLSCISLNSKEPCAADLCTSIIKLWRTACSGNEQNQQLLLECSTARQHLLQMLASPVPEIQRESLALLCMCSQTQRGRELLTDKLYSHQMVEELVSSVCRDSSSTSAMTLLQNLAADKKFKILSREHFTDVFALRLEHLLSNTMTSDSKTLASMISLIGSLALDDVINKDLVGREEFWRCSLQSMMQCVGCEYTSVLYALLGLLINLASKTSPVMQDHAVLFSRRCLELLSDSSGGVITRACGLMSALLPKSSDATQEVVQNDGVKKLLRILKAGGEMSSRYSIKALTVCTASTPQACEELVKLDKRLQTLRKLLGGTDELVVGNAALCLGHCLKVEGAASGLLGTDCVPLLLRWAAGDSKRAAVQQNAAITLGKLCKVEPRHKGKLRELHGLEVLHSR
ncbi:hypothetical protein DNTS_025736 [Danionella cerebrum]|uniref:Uncharacterized protein n=1 Tax=Danionella cerebrum TaxID=2873325 RepID=A0A553NLX5_9TELE|nr:hypothetical protein DNTS_025736 [Danionella translucida]